MIFPADIRERGFATEIAVLLLTALAVFIFTVVVGILNGTDIVDFDQKVILTHVHTGTLGWLTLCVFAASLWLFGEGPLDDGMRRAARVLTYASIVTFLVYNYAFLTTYGEFRPAVGAFALLAIAGFLVWVVLRARHVELTTPHLGILAAVATSVVGGVVGVLLGMRLATGDQWIPAGGEDAHPATMVIGFLVPVAMALGEWTLTWPKPARLSRAGIIQMALPFTGGVMILIGLLWDIDPLVQLSLPLEVAGIAIYLYRMRRPLLDSVKASAPWQARFAAISPIYLAVVILLFVYLIIDYDGDPDLIPMHKILAVDHLTFVGAMTNAIFALLLTVLGGRLRKWSALPAVVFFAMNVGLVFFVVGLYFDETAPKHMGTPVLGAALLVAIGAFLAAFVLPPDGDERSPVASNAPTS